MKTHLPVIFLAILLSIFFTSCQKSLDGDPTTASPTVPPPNAVLPHDTSFLVKTYIQTSNGDSTVINYTYDQQGRVITEKYSTGLSKVYSYGSNCFTVTNLIHSAVNSREEHLLINSIEDSVTYFGPNTDTTSEKYIYDGYKHVVVEKQYTKRQLTNTITAQYDDANKNLVRVNVAANQQISYTYTNYPYHINFGLIYEPPSKDNLVETTTFSGGLNLVQVSKYEFDSLNRVSKETLTNQATNQTLLVHKYIY